ncbi:hypothetical protein EJB05_35332, partial [Eragrostis curvula]
MPTVPLRRLVKDDQWEAEDLAGRLGIVAHAAFLRAGFVPYGDEPSSGLLLKQVDEVGPSAPSFSRRYTLAQLARRREGADVAVQELRAHGNGDVAFRAYVLTTDGHRRRLCRAVLDAAALAPLLSGRVDDAARAMETGYAGSWLWKSLVDWVFPVLHLELCRRNDLPVTGFASLPDDAKAEILKRLSDGKDLAMVECTNRQLRRLVAERDGELWKAMYESLGLSPEAESSDEGGNWKQRYLNSRQQLRLTHWTCPYDDGPLLELFELELQRLWDFPSPWEDPFVVSHVESTGFDYPPPPYMVHDPPAPPPEPEVVVARGKNAGRKRRKVPRHDFQKKRHGAGAIHSPSSRYRWKHR